MQRISGVLSPLLVQQLLLWRGRVTLAPRGSKRTAHSGVNEPFVVEALPHGTAALFRLEQGRASHGLGRFLRRLLFREYPPSDMAEVQGHQTGHHEGEGQESCEDI